MRRENILETHEYNGVTLIKMGRDLGGKVLYWVSACLINSLLVDTGCKHTAEKMVACLQDREVSQSLITHYHEDHIGGCLIPSPIRSCPQMKLIRTFMFSRLLKPRGNSEDHVVYIEPNRGLCFSGDLFVSEKIKVL